MSFASTNTEPPAAPPGRPRRRAGWRLIAALALAVVLVLFLIAVVSLYLARRTLGRDAVVGWLRERGVEAVIDVERLEPDGFTGKIRIGPAADPEIVVDRAEVKYRLLGFWNGRPLGVEVAEVRLVRPVAKASWSKGKFSVGSLDKVLDEFRQAPPRPDARQPTIRIEGGRVILATDYGRADVNADGLLEDGKLMRLSAQLQPTTLRIGEVRADVKGLRMTMVTRGARVAVVAEGDLNTISAKDAAAEVAHLRLSGEGPYPDLKNQRGDGIVKLALQANADRVKAAGAEAEKVGLEATYDGEAAGWIDSLAVKGTLKTAVRTAGLRYEDFRLTRTSVEGEGPAGFTAKDGVRMTLAADARAQGAWLGMGPLKKDDDPTILAAKRMLGRFDFAAPGVQVAVAPDLSLRLTQAARLTGAGGLAVITPQNGAAVFAGNGGAFHLALSGGGLPTAEASVPRYDLTPGGAKATVSSLVAKGSLATLVDADIKTAGRFSLDNGLISFWASNCSPVKLGRLELGENDVDTISGELCPTKDPLLTLNDGAWRVRAKAVKIAANAPFLEARVEDGAGTFDMSGKELAFQADAAVDGVKVVDAAKATRFNPVLISGTAVSRGGDWTGDFAASDPQGRALGKAHLVQTLATQSGTMTFDTGTLSFAQGGLQPGALSPLAAAIASPVNGGARFQGKIGWTEGSDLITGDGVLDLTDFGFQSPVGALSGLNGRVTLTSLAPPVTAPDQKLTVAKISSFVPLTDVAAAVSLDAAGIKVSGAELAVAQGRLKLDPFTVPLDGKAWEGVLHVEGLQLADLVKASPFADRVDIDAKMSGTVPFTVTPEGLRIAEGKLAADRAGRLSIRREVLSNVAATGGDAAVTEGPAAVVAAAQSAPAAPPPPPNTVADIAYQAMENLAFDTMDVTLNSLPNGRLGGLFHIKGRHDPPTRQVIRLSLIDLITKKFLQKDLPLPSGTEVNLTLDSSLNLDDVLRDVLSTSPATPPAATDAGSASVQP